MATTAHAQVHVSDHAFGILDHGDIPIETADWSSGLIVLMSSGAFIYTGIDRGYVNVTVTVQPDPIAEVDLAPNGQPWDDIVESSLTAPLGDLRVESYENGPVPELPLLSPNGPGSYRLRAHVRGRDTDYDAVRNDPVEDYLLVIWPAAAQPVHVIRATDRCGRQIYPAP
jgi:hypothetical protein